MTHGVDASFLIALEIDEHLDHASAKDTFVKLVAKGDRFAIAPQVLAEFLHTVTDTRRFRRPLSMTIANQTAERWWNAAEVDQVFPDSLSTTNLFDWLRRYSLGRKRILDTLFAATVKEVGVTSILTLNSADFAVFGAFHCVVPTRSAAPRSLSSLPSPTLRARPNSLSRSPPIPRRSSGTSATSRASSALCRR